MSNRIGLIETIEHLRQVLADENISYGELAFIDQLADEYGILITEGMMASDILDALEEVSE